MLLFNEKQIQSILREYKEYYNTMRPHQGIDQKMPLEALEKETLTGGKIDNIPILGGLHHHYFKSRVNNPAISIFLVTSSIGDLYVKSDIPVLFF